MPGSMYTTRPYLGTVMLFCAGISLICGPAGVLAAAPVSPGTVTDAAAKPASATAAVRSRSLLSS